MSAAREKLRTFIDQVIMRGTFTLKSGKQSNYYLDGRLLTLQAEPLNLIAQVVLEATADDDVVAVGGPALGAVPMVGAIVALSQNSARPLAGIMIRPEPKEHGRGRMVEGPPLEEGQNIFLVEDVTTTGGSVLRAAQAVKDEYKVNVLRVITLFDRQEGSEQAFQAAGIPLSPIFIRSDFGL